jgi:hypothetical protein
MDPLSHCLIFFFFKTSEKSLVFFFLKKPVQLIVNNIFIFIFKKISLRWIKFTRTVISILSLIIFYLILLHAQKIMKTVVLVEW